MTLASEDKANYFNFNIIKYEGRNMLTFSVDVHLMPLLWPDSPLLDFDLVID
jgi:hypothetical protein